MMRIGSRISCLFSSFSLSLLRGPIFGGYQSVGEVKKYVSVALYTLSSHCERCVAYQAGGGGVNPFQGASRLAIRSQSEGSRWLDLSGPEIGSLKPYL